MALAFAEGDHHRIDGRAIRLHPIIDELVSDSKKNHPYTDLPTPDRDLLHAAIGQLVTGKILNRSYIDGNSFIDMGKFLVESAVKFRIINEEEGQKLLDLGSETPQSIESQRSS